MKQFNKIINFLSYIYHRNNWILSWQFPLKKYKNIKINQPIFLLSIQGGGSTLISRILRRNKDIINFPQEKSLLNQGVGFMQLMN